MSPCDRSSRIHATVRLGPQKYLQRIFNMLSNCKQKSTAVAYVPNDIHLFDHRLPTPNTSSQSNTSNTLSDGFKHSEASSITLKHVRKVHS